MSPDHRGIWFVVWSSGNLTSWESGHLYFITGPCGHLVILSPGHLKTLLSNYQDIWSPCHRYMDKTYQPKTYQQQNIFATKRLGIKTYRQHIKDKTYRWTKRISDKTY
jgi:hypothetical protein